MFAEIVKRNHNPFHLFPTTWDWDDFPFSARTKEAVYPAVNVYKKENEIIVTAEVPGVKKEDIKIEVKNRTLKISGKKETNVEEGVKAHYVERGNFQFERTLSLPNDIDDEKVEAKYEDGILTVTLPKAEKEKPKHVTVH